jgi:hypothetical protein
MRHCCSTCPGTCNSWSEFTAVIWLIDICTCMDLSCKAIILFLGQKKRGGRNPDDAGGLMQGLGKGPAGALVGTEDSRVWLVRRGKKPISLQCFQKQKRSSKDGAAMFGSDRRGCGRWHGKWGITGCADGLMLDTGADILVGLKEHICILM